MPESRFVAAAKLKPLIIYFGVAFVVLLGLASVIPPGRARNLLVAGWIVLFPVGGWFVFRRG